MDKRICLDSAAILSFLIGEPGRGHVMKAALHQAMTPDSSMTFFASAISIVEVAYIATPTETMETGFAIIDDFWNTSPIRLVETHSGIAHIGKDLIRQRLAGHSGSELPSVRKRAADIVHLATAVWLKADEFWTYDIADFSRYPQDGVLIRDPTASCCWEMVCESLSTRRFVGI